jgi:hypothetical protein
MLDIAALTLVATALLAYCNYRFFGLPTTIGVMAGALSPSLALIGLDALGVAHGLLLYGQALLRTLDFSAVPGRCHRKARRISSPATSGPSIRARQRTEKRDAELRRSGCVLEANSRVRRGSGG